jgi:hypothetical protein
VNTFCPKLSAISALLLGLCRPAHAAEAPRVLLVRPSAAAPAVQTALVRVEGELTADGFEVVPIEAPAGSTSAMSMLQAENTGPATTVGLFLSADGTSAELWVVDKLTDKTVVRRLATSGQPENMLPEVLAVRAVELLRASLLELTLERNSAALASRAALNRATEWAARPVRNVPPVWGIETGAAVIWNPSQVEPAFVSVGRGRFALEETLHLRASFIGLGTRPQVTSATGSASVAQWCALAELIFAPLREATVRPAFSVGAGAFHTSVSGTAVWPYQGLRTSHWAFAADAGLGLSLRIGSRLELASEMHALWLTPEPVVRFVNEDGPHLGRPGVVGSLSLLGWL